MSTKIISGRTGDVSTTAPQQQISEHSQSDMLESAMQTSGVSVLNERGMNQNAVERHAYEIYEQSGCVAGRCKQNWALAEHELCNNSKGGA